MKKILMIGVSCMIFITWNIQAQTQTQDDVKNSMIYKLQRGVYNRALKYNDPGAAIYALYNLCALDPRNDSLLFALQYLYYNNQQYIPSILVANDVLLLNSNNLNAQEMKAVSLERVGANDKAIDEYESLYLKHNNNITYLYKTAALQYSVKRYKEAKTNVDIMLTNNMADSLRMTFPKGDSAEQQVTMKASLYNLKGLIDQAMGNPVDAKNDFNKALEIVPDFYLARQNLDSLNADIKKPK
jgi:tetratricopeptide (TPR) repeat protein